MKILFLLFFLLFSCSSSKNTLPPIEVRDLEGREVKLSSLKGNNVVLYVWSRTCAGHTKDLKRLRELVVEHPDYRVISYAIAMDVEDVKKSYQELSIEPNFMTLVDTAVKFNDYFPITFLPSTYVFDKRGKLVASYPGLPLSF